MSQSIGPIIFDLIGTDLNHEESEILKHPLIGGVILFTRNYESPLQLKHLCETIRKTKKTPLLIGVDQEGGRVQRFRDGFTRIPPMGEIGKLYEMHPQQALQQAEQYGWLMATELLEVGIDLSFAPVLDLNKELNTVIGDRAFHHQPQIVSELAKALMKGMHKAGMAATGKHFPGHGSVNWDSHVAMPVDKRSFAQIAQEDLNPFVDLIHANIEAIMPAHISFPAVDTKPVGFSDIWLRKILREQLKFKGIVISDDLNMEGASVVGGYAERAQSALQAGCDMILICNNRAGTIKIVENLSSEYLLPLEKIKPLQARPFRVHGNGELI